MFDKLLQLHMSGSPGTTPCLAPGPRGHQPVTWQQGPGPHSLGPGFFAQLDRAVRVPILAGAGAALIRRGDTVLGALAVSGAMMPGQDDECAEAALAALVP